MLPIEECDQMNYPSKVMKISELMKMGFPKEYLMIAYRSRKQTFAWKMDATKSNSPILFDTEGLEEYRRKQISIEQQKNNRIRLVV